MPQDKPSRDPAAPPGTGEALRPTVIKPPAAGARGRKAAPSAAAPPTPREPSRPTALPGTRRVRIEASPRELRALSPEASAAVCEAAARLLEQTVADTMNERKAVLWGHELQKAYGDEVGATLALAQDPLAEQARAHVDRMTQLLASIDLMAVCGHGKGGLLSRLASSMNDRVDTPAELAGALGELRLLLDRLGDATASLATLADRLHQRAGAIDRIGRDVDAAAVAALFLARHFEREAPALARRFDDRATSLTATVAQIRQGDAVHRLQLQRPLDLIGVIQNVALVMLPGLLAAMAALLALAKSRGASPTEARDMSHQLRDILNQLQT